MRRCSSMVEHQPSKLDTWVRFPSPALLLSDRTAMPMRGYAIVAQLVERDLAKVEAAGSSPVYRFPIILCMPFMKLSAGQLLYYPNKNFAGGRAMRIARLRFDIWLCGVLALLAAWGTGKLVDKSLPASYEQYEEEHQAADGEIGGIAGDDVVRAQSVEDLISNEVFTIATDDVYYWNNGGGYYGSYYLYNIELPSGERIAAMINQDGVQNIGDYEADGNILPVGRVVYEDLTQNQAFLEQIQYGNPLSRTDFYVDMLGEGAKVSKSTYSEHRKIPLQIAAFLAVFILVHLLGAKLGIFPRFFMGKKRQSEWQ